jgi:hypothetical protein
LVASKHKTVTDTQCRCRVVKNDSEPIWIIYNQHYVASRMIGEL